MYDNVQARVNEVVAQVERSKPTSWTAIVGNVDSNGSCGGISPQEFDAKLDARIAKLPPGPSGPAGAFRALEGRLACKGRKVIVESQAQLEKREKGGLLARLEDFPQLWVM